MSTFECKVRTVTQLTPHPNADRLELVVIGGYMAVVQKDIHKVGDLILYIPEDACFTDFEIVKALGIGAYLTGKHKNRVKAVRLRGCLSQGIVLPLSVIEGVLALLGFGYYSFHDGIDFREELKIEKYEEAIPIMMAGRARRWPTFLPKYDIENIKRPESMNVLVEGEEVVATEKLHGTNMAIAIGEGLEDGERVFVCSRNHALLEDYENVYWRATAKYELDRIIQEIATELQQTTSNFQNVSLHGEVIGVQDLKYGFENGEIGFHAFDIRINGQFIDYDLFLDYCTRYGIPMVPVVFRGPYNYEAITLWANAVGSRLHPDTKIMEGVVVKPVQERYDYKVGRVLFKFISESYLLRKDGTELQ